MTKPKAKQRLRLPAPGALPPAPVEPPAQMPGFETFVAADFTQKVPGGKQGEERYLTVSPLRAIMAEQAEVDEHVVTERTRQGVLYGVGLGLERRVVARILGITVEEMETLYADECETAGALLMNDIQTNLYNIARDPRHGQSVRAGMFLLGKIGNDLYREAKKSSAVAVDPQTRTIDPALLDDEQRHALRSIIESALRLAAGPQPEPVEGEYDEVDETDDAEDLL